MNKSTVPLLAAFLFAAVLFQAAEAAVPQTLVTFLDPGTISFRFTGGAGIAGLGQLDAWNNDIMLDIVNGPLALPGVVPEYLNASFILTDPSGGPLDVMADYYAPGGFLLGAYFEGGKLEFYDDTTSLLIFGAAFDGAWLNPLSFGATFTMGQLLNFYGPAVLPEYEDRTFSFSLVNVSNANAFGGGSPIKSFTATSSFTSSALLVPEPSSLVPLLSACGMFAVLGRMIRRRR